MQRWRVRQAANLLNGSTVLGLVAATVTRARLTGTPRGLWLATEARLPARGASAITLGDVVLTRHDEHWLRQRPELLAHEERHSWQYVVLLGVPMLPAYGVAAVWSLLRGGDHSTHNVFETRAGLADGGYSLVSRRQRRRGRTA